MEESLLENPRILQKRLTSWAKILEFVKSITRRSVKKLLFKEAQF